MKLNEPEVFEIEEIRVERPLTDENVHVEANYRLIVHDPDRKDSRGKRGAWKEVRCVDFCDDHLGTHDPGRYVMLVKEAEEL